MFYTLDQRRNLVADEGVAPRSRYEGKPFLGGVMPALFGGTASAAVWATGHGVVTSDLEWAALPTSVGLVVSFAYDRVDRRVSRVLDRPWPEGDREDQLRALARRTSWLVRDPAWRFVVDGNSRRQALLEVVGSFSEKTGIAIVSPDPTDSGRWAELEAAWRKPPAVIETRTTTTPAPDTFEWAAQQARLGYPVHLPALARAGRGA